MSKSLRAWILGLALVGASTFLFAHLTCTPRSPDEQAYLAWSLKWALEGHYAEPDQTPVTKVPPLHCFLVSRAFRFSGNTMEAAQVVSALGGALCVGVVYALGVVWGGVRAGLLAGVLLATSGKGEFWHYSNRVLNDVLLTLWVSLILLFLVLHWKRNRWYTGVLTGVFLGLGLLTKEFALLTLPLFPVLLVWGQGRFASRLVQLALALLVAALLVAPWILHVRNVTGSTAGGLAQRGKGEALQLLKRADSWGMRDANTLVDNLLLRGMPSGPFRLIYAASLLFSLICLARRRSPEGLLLAVSLVFVWLLVFQIFLPLPLTRRQLLPLLPVYNVLAGLFLTYLWAWFRDRLRSVRVPGSWVGVAGWAGAAGLIFLNLPPHLWPQVKPFHLLQYPGPRFLEPETRAALKSAPDARLLVSNYPRLLYFYSGGAMPVLPFVPGVNDSVEPSGGRAVKRKKSIAGEQGENSPSALWFRMTEKMKGLCPAYLVLFYPGEQGCDKQQHLLGGIWEETSCGLGHRVFKLRMNPA